MCKLINFSTDDKSFLASALEVLAQDYPNVSVFIKETQERVKSNDVLKTDSVFLLNACTKAKEIISKCIGTEKDPMMMQAYREKMLQATELQKKIGDLKKDGQIDIEEVNTAVKGYLSGPMSGLPNNNSKAFNDAEADLFCAGYRVVNPVKVGLALEEIARRHNREISYLDYLVQDLLELMNCSYVVVLPGWEKSMGACIEVILSIHRGLKVYEYPSLRPVDVSISIHVKQNEMCSSDVAISSGRVCSSCNHKCLKHE